jgi:hypothetical protein
MAQFSGHGALVYDRLNGGTRAYESVLRGALKCIVVGSS